MPTAKPVRVNQRTRKGQVLAETAVSLIIFGALFVLITPFIINFFYATSYHWSLEQIAGEAAKNYESNVSMGQDSETASFNASGLAYTLAGQLGLPAANLSTSFNDQGSFVVCTASDSFVPPYLSTAFGSLFTLTAKGVSAKCICSQPAAK